MNLHAYLTKHDGKPTPSGAECIRLATASELTPYFLYMTALGHKRVGAERAERISSNSIGAELEASQVNNNNARNKSGRSKKRL